MLPRKAQQRVDMVPVPQTNTGGQVEHTKASGITMVKELGKLPPQLREKEDPSSVMRLAL